MTQLRLFDSYAPENQTEYDIWENSLTAQFGSSLGRFLRQRNWPDLRATPDTTTDIIQNAERHADKPLDRSFLKLATQALAGQFVRTTIQGIVAECSAMCESPIELAMCFALGLAGCDKTHGVQFSCHGQVFGDSDRELSLTIEPQCNLGIHRADFLLTMQLVETAPQVTIHRKQLVLECYGWDFHERTTAQAIRDRQMDRNLQMQGLSVFRYTGSEIWADVFSCAEEAIGFLQASVEAQKAAALLRRKQPERVRLQAEASATG